MIFAIQISNPQIVYSNEKVFEYISSAIQSIYPMDTEDIILSWNHFIIRINYKYDLSVIFQDIVDMLDEIFVNQKKEYDVTFGSNTFHSNWEIKIEDSTIKIKSRWIGASGQSIELLNQKEYLEIDFNSFLCEWKILFRQIIDSFEKANIVIIEDNSLLEKIYEIESKIPNYGKLYSHLNN